MGLTGDPIRLRDIANVEAFVERTLQRSQISYSAQEHEELLAEGLAILYELSAGYKPLAARPGIDAQPGRFSGYAAMFLPRRLGDAWHRNHPEHRYITDPDTGKRGWRYGRPALSLDGLTDSTLDEQHRPDRLMLNAKGINAFCHATRAATQRVLGCVASGALG